MKLIRYAGRNLAVPVSESVMEFLMNGNFSGSVAVLTRTNDEALEILDLLLKQKVPARLIQSNDGFNLSSLAEIRYFMDRLHIRDEGAVISDDDWESAKSDFYSVFSSPFISRA